jgi:hypothetical protein
MRWRSTTGASSLRVARTLRVLLRGGRWSSPLGLAPEAGLPASGIAVERVEAPRSWRLSDADVVVIDDLERLGPTELKRCSITTWRRLATAAARRRAIPRSGTARCCPISAWARSAPGASRSRHGVAHPPMPPDIRRWSASGAARER